MSKGVKWVTLTPEERRMVQPSYFPGSSQASESGNIPLVKQHTCDVQLPDRTACRVTYQRDAAQWHRFQFAEPISQRLYVNARMSGNMEDVEAKAQELAAQAYKQAQQAEQKEMQRGTPPPGPRIPVPACIPLLRPKTAHAQAGQYTVCVAFASGNLMPVGRLLYPHPEAAVCEWEQTMQQRAAHSTTAPLVVGICCRWQRRWTRAQFVVYPLIEPTEAAPKPTKPRASRKRTKQADGEPPA